MEFAEGGNLKNLITSDKVLTEKMIFDYIL